MFRPLIAPILAGTLALSPVGAVPAQADPSEAAKVIGTIALLALIGKALEDAGDAKAQPAPVQGRHPGPGYGNGYGHKRPLPAECRETLRENGQNVTVYGKHCVSQNMRFADRLPDECVRTVEVFGNDRKVYGAHCLRRHGWPV